jgi:hypothetical protein
VSAGADGAGELEGCGVGLVGGAVAAAGVGGAVVLEDVLVLVLVLVLVATLSGITAGPASPSPSLIASCSLYPAARRTVVTMLEQSTPLGRMSERCCASTCHPDATNNFLASGYCQHLETNTLLLNLICR